MNPVVMKIKFLLQILQRPEGVSRDEYLDILLGLFRDSDITRILQDALINLEAELEG